MIGLSLGLSPCSGGMPLSVLAFPKSVSSMVAFGNSITAGVNASDAAHRWANIVAAYLGSTLNNSGISGTVLQNRNLSGGSPQASNGLSRYVTDLTGANKKSMVIIAYLLNDGRYTGAPATMNVANAILDYRTMLQGLFTAGYTTNRITIVTPHWFPDAGFSSGTAGFTGQNRAGYETFVKASRDLAHEFGVYLADSYAAMMAVGSSIIDTDNIHPLDAGHAIIANSIINSRLQLADAFVYDSFTAPDGTDFTTRNGEVGAKWTLCFGYSPGTPAPQINLNRLYNTALSSVYAASGTPPSMDYDVVALFNCLSVIGGDNIGIFARGNVVNTDYRYFGRFLQGTGYQLFRTLAGVSTQIGSTAGPTSMLAGEAHRVILRVQGSGPATVSLFVDDDVTPLITTTDSSAALAQVGLAGIRMATAKAAATGIQIDEFYARPIVPIAA